MKAIFDLPEAHTRALEIIYNRMLSVDILWALTGSAGLRLQGVDIPIHDLDIQSDQAGIYEMERRLSEFIFTPVHIWESEYTRSLFGKAKIAGIGVDLIGDMAHLKPDGGWEPPSDLKIRVFVGWHNLHIPVLPLGYEASAYEKMGRLEKASKIRAVLKVGGRKIITENTDD
ncbi:MAG: hypothetical protein B5M51_04020 [Anaerolinea sp. 4484_236]|nr:MAG: hypothetical protein B5M51_04020 [Anaerolinea sp. 4484_236]